jgi:hypothetical protein
MFGLVSIKVSLYQMLRGGSSIAFTSSLKHFCIPGDGLQPHNWVVRSFLLACLFVSWLVHCEDDGWLKTPTLEPLPEGTQNTLRTSEFLPSSALHGSNDSLTSARCGVQGVALCVVSILLCGVSVMFEGDPVGHASLPQKHTHGGKAGVCLILMGGLVQSLQYVFEERVMSDDMGLAPMLVVGTLTLTLTRTRTLTRWASKARGAFRP